MNYSEENLAAIKKADVRYIEDDLKVLKDIEREIDNLLKQRLERLEAINRQHSMNDLSVQDSHRWFANNVVGISSDDCAVEDSPTTYSGRR